MNQRTDFVLPECYIDTNLVETLSCTGGCNHQKGCNQVVKVMREKFANRFAVGIIDADKRRPGYLTEFHEIASSEHIKLLRHIQRPHYIILVHPAADGFILACAEKIHINVEDYGLPSVLKEFTAQTKDVMSNKDVRFKRLFKAMLDEGEMKLMKGIIDYLVVKTYNAKEEDIIAIFNSRYRTP